MALNLILAVIFLVCLKGVPPISENHNGCEQFAPFNLTMLPHGQPRSLFTSVCLYNVLIQDGPKISFSPSLMVLSSVISNLSIPQLESISPGKQPLKVTKSLSRSLILLLLFVSGNINVNPGPHAPENLLHLSTPADMANTQGLGFLLMNARSIVP